MDETEQLITCFDRSPGMRAVIAIDDTTLGSGDRSPFPLQEVLTTRADST